MGQLVIFWVIFRDFRGGGILHSRKGNYDPKDGGQNLILEKGCLRSVLAPLPSTSLKAEDSREAPDRFGSVTVWGWNGSSGSGFRFRRFLFKKGSWWTFRIFSIFSAQGSPRCREGRGGTAFHWKSQDVGGFSRAGGVSSGREGVCGKFFGGGAYYFFSGPKFPPRGFLCFSTFLKERTVPVPLSVSGKTALTVPVSDSGSVPEPPCKFQAPKIWKFRARKKCNSIQPAIP